MDANALGVIVPVWNRASEAIGCLERLAAIQRPPLAVFVIDNGSEPAAGRLLCEFCARLPERFALVSCARNLGFAGAVNLGLERAFTGGAPAALVLNSDALVEPGSIGILYDTSRSRPRAGILGPRILDPARGGREVSAGERVWLWALPLPRSLLRYRANGRQVRSVAAVLGCAIFITRRCYEAIGALEEGFFAYYEEIDYCLRALAAGFEVLVCSHALVLHERGRGFAGGFEPLSAYLKARNLLLLMRRHGAWHHWPPFALEYALLLLASAATHALRGRADVVAALARGAAHGLARRTGPPPGDLEAAGRRARGEERMP